MRGIFHQTGNGYSGLFRAGEGEGGLEQEWHPTSLTLMPVRASSLAVTSPQGLSPQGL